MSKHNLMDDESTVSMLEESLWEKEADDAENLVYEKLRFRDDTVPEYAHTVREGAIYRRQKGLLYLVTPKSSDIAARIIGLCGLRDTQRSLLEIQTRNDANPVVETFLRNQLNELYDDFVRKYGPVNSRVNRRAFTRDRDRHLVLSLEKADPVRAGEWVKSDIFYRSILAKTKTIKPKDTNAALGISMSLLGEVNLEEMSLWLEKGVKEIGSELQDLSLAFPDPQTEQEGQKAKWLPAVNYLSGNIAFKLTEAQEAAQSNPLYLPNVEALQRILPRSLEPDEVNIPYGASWLPEQTMVNYASYFTKIPTEFLSARYNHETSKWQMDISAGFIGYLYRYITDDYDIQGYSVEAFLEAAANQSELKMSASFAKMNGMVFDAASYDIAYEKIQNFRHGFAEWLQQNPDHLAELTAIYNSRYNSFVVPQYDGSDLILPGLSTMIDLRSHQKDAVIRCLQSEQNTLLAHEAGTGKTFAMIAAAMEMKRLGKAKKTLVAVPVNLVDQWAAEVMRLYPMANILAINAEEFKSSSSEDLLERIKMVDWDMVIMSHTSLRKFPAPKEYSASLPQTKYRAHDKHSLQVGSFADLGFDHLFVDEAHEFKTLPITSQKRNLVGLTRVGSVAARDLLAKIRYLEDHKNGPVVVFATGTPLTNSVMEMYTMQTFLQHQRLQEMKLDKIDAWLSTFGVIENEYELNSEGTGFKSVKRLRSFNNVPEIMGLFREIADIRTANSLLLPAPNIENGVPKIVVAPKPVELARFQEDLLLRAEKAKFLGSQIEQSPLQLTHELRQAALDIRLIDENNPDLATSKVNRLVNNVFDIWVETSQNRSTQIIFCDISVPKDSFNIYDDICAKLVRSGIPQGEIASVQNIKSREREELFERFRRGEIRILLGSTSTLGFGANLQNKSVAVHNLDAPWRPADLTQRLARAVRQGNENDEVRVFNYITEGSYDAYVYQLLEIKAHFIEQIMSAGNEARSSGDLGDVIFDYAHIKALATGDPLVREFDEIERQIKKLESMKLHYRQAQEQIQSRLRVLPKKKMYLEQTLRAQDKDLEMRKNKDVNDLELDGIKITRKSDWALAIIEFINSDFKNEHKLFVSCGSYQGLTLKLGFTDLPTGGLACLQLGESISISLDENSTAQGLLVRLASCVRNLDKDRSDIFTHLEALDLQEQLLLSESQENFGHDELLKDLIKQKQQIEERLVSQAFKARQTNREQSLMG